MHKNKFIDQIVNNIRFEQKLIYILITLKACSLNVRFSNLKRYSPNFIQFIFQEANFVVHKQRLLVGI